MPITLFSIVLTCLALYFLFRKDTMHRRFRNLLALAAIIHISAIRGYYLVVGSQSEVNYDLFISCVMLVVSLAYIFIGYVHLDRTPLIFAVLLIGGAIISIGAEYCFPYPNLIINSNTTGGWDAYIMGEEVKNAVVIKWSRISTFFAISASYLLTLMVAKKIICKQDLVIIVKTITSFFYLITIFMVFEWLSKSFFGGMAYESCMNIIFGSGQNTFFDLLERGTGYQLQGLSREPAHFSFMLFWGIVFFIIQYKVLAWKKFPFYVKIQLVLMMIFMFISGSFSSYIYVPIIVLFLIYIYNKHYHYKYLKYLSGFILLLGAFFISYTLNDVDSSTYFGQRIMLTLLAIDLIDSGNIIGIGASSSLTRLVSIHDTFFDFLQRPLFGLGPTVQISHGGLANFLSDIGIWGLVCWLGASFSGSGHKYHYLPIFILLVLPNIFMGVLTINTAFAMCTPLIILCFQDDNSSDEVQK